MSRRRKNPEIRVKSERAMRRDALDAAKRFLDRANSGDALIVEGPVTVIPKESIEVKTWELMDDFSGFKAHRWEVTKRGKLGRESLHAWHEPTPGEFLIWAKAQTTFVLRRALGEQKISVTGGDTCQLSLAHRLVAEYEDRWRSRNNEPRATTPDAVIRGRREVIAVLAKKGVKDEAQYFVLLDLMMFCGHSYVSAIKEMRKRMAQKAAEKKIRSTAEIKEDIEREAEKAADDEDGKAPEQGEDEGSDAPKSERDAVKAPKRKPKAAKAEEKKAAEPEQGTTEKKTRSEEKVKKAPEKKKAAEKKAAPAKKGKEKVTASSFKVGQKVKYTGRNEKISGKSGVVAKVEDDAVRIKVGDETYRVSPGSVSA